MGRGGGAAAAAPDPAPAPAAEAAKAAAGGAAEAGEAKKAASSKGGGDNAPRRQLETLNHLQSKSSNFRGVSWSKHKQKWQSCIRISNRQFFLGRFVEPELAARAYDRAAICHYGADNCRTNFPLSDYAQERPSLEQMDVAAFAQQSQQYSRELTKLSKRASAKRAAPAKAKAKAKAARNPKKKPRTAAAPKPAAPAARAAPADGAGEAAAGEAAAAAPLLEAAREAAADASQDTSLGPRSPVKAGRRGAGAGPGDVPVAGAPDQELSALQVALSHCMLELGREQRLLRAAQQDGLTLDEEIALMQAELKAKLEEMLKCQAEILSVRDNITYEHGMQAWESTILEYAAEVVPALSAHLQVQHPNAQQATV